jgi:large repetitive protein
MALWAILVVGAAAGCSKSYSLSPADGGSDHTSGVMTGTGGTGVDAERHDVQITSDTGDRADVAFLDGATDLTPDTAPGDVKSSDTASADSGSSDTELSDGHSHDSEADSPPDGGLDSGDDGQTLPMVLSIPTIRDPAAVNHPPSGALVQTSGIVTAVKSAGPTHTMFLQAMNVTKYAGVYIYVGSASVTNLAPGAIVEVIGVVSNYRGIDQIDTTVGSFRVTGVAAAVPTPMDVAPGEIATGGARATELQSMLVHLNTTVITITATVGTDFQVSPGGLIITSFVANGTGASPFPVTVGQTFSSITGPLYTFGSVGTPDFKLAPRGVFDLVSL